MGISGVSEQTPQLGLFKWEDGPDRYNHIELYQNWNVIDTSLLKKTWALTGDEATQIRFGGNGTVTLPGTSLIIRSSQGTASDTQDRHNVNVNGLMTWGPGGTVATDTNLYRSGSAILKTDGTFQGSSFVSSGKFNTVGSGTATSFLVSSVTGDANARFFMDVTGAMVWSPGTASADVNLYRSAVNVLKTDNGFVIGSGSVTLNDFVINRSGSGTAQANGNFVVTGNMQVNGNITVNGTTSQGSVSLSNISAASMNISGAGTVNTLVVTNAATFNSAAGSTTFSNGFNIAGTNFTVASGTVTIPAVINATGYVSSGRAIGMSGLANQVAIGDKGGSAAITFGQNEDVNIRRVNATDIRTNANVTVDGTLTVPTVNLGSPSSTAKALNIGGDIFLNATKAIFFGNTSAASGAGDRLNISFNSGNGFVDYATGNLYFRTNNLTNTLILNSDNTTQVQAIIADVGGAYKTTHSSTGIAITQGTSTIAYLNNSGASITGGGGLSVTNGAFFGSIAGFAGTLTVSSNLDMTNHSILNQSDAALKEDFVIVPDKDILKDFNQLYVSNWVWKTKEQRGIGPTAQQLQQTSLGKFLVKDGEDGYLRVDNTNMQGMLFAAVSALTRKVKELEQKLGYNG